MSRSTSRRIASRGSGRCRIEDATTGITYCLGMLLDEGLVMIADPRTNAGVDDFSIYKKLHRLTDTSDRQIFLASAGNLSMSQTVMGLLREGLPESDSSDMPRT